jgi:hypothetical protein
MPAQAGARYIKRERVATLESVEAGWVKLWRQVHPLPVESKAELQSLIESYLRRNQPKPARPAERCRQRLRQRYRHGQP